LLIGGDATAQALATAGPGRITYVENGWYGEGMAIVLEASLSGCPAPANQFAVIAGHPSYKEITAMVIAAYLAGTPVQLVVEQGQCVFGNRTKIVSVRMIR
jgi:hypothetical protein